MLVLHVVSTTEPMAVDMSSHAHGVMRCIMLGKMCGTLQKLQTAMAKSAI